MAVRPPLRYPGGKWKALPKILPLIPENIEDWREPFFGGGSVTLGYIQSHKFTAKRLLVGDLSTEIWAFWEGIKLYSEEVARLVKEFFIEKAPTQLKVANMTGIEDNYQEIYDKALSEGRELWKWLQEVDCEKMTLPERAARTFISNRISFSAMTDSGTLSC